MEHPPQGSTRALTFIHALINPMKKTVEFEYFPNHQPACDKLGLPSGELDHGIVGQTHDYNVCIFVYEYGLVRPQHPNGWWSLNGQLFNGPAVLYAANNEGETIDIPQVLRNGSPSHLEQHIIWIGDKEHVERLIQMGEINRPQTFINGESVWSWS